MFKTLLFVALIIALVNAAPKPPSKPSFPDSFTANVEFTEVLAHMNFSIYGTWYVDFVGRQHAFRTTLDRRGPLQVYRYFNKSQQFEFFPQHRICNEQMGMKMPFFGTFDFLSRAVMTGQCEDRNGNQGNLWLANILDKPGTSFQISLCASPDNTIPFFIDARGQFNFQNWERLIQFFGYYPGLPAPSYFALPQACVSQ